MHDLRKFQKGLEELNIVISDAQMQQFLIFYEMLVERNKVMNLTAITEFDEVVEKHFLDSLCLVKAMPELDGKMRLLDLGTGAGFPGIPLKIVFPNLNIVLLDSLNKRVQFLNDVIAELGFTDTVAVHGRAEELARKPEYRQQFDVCVSRAVSNLASLSEYCLPFVKIGGQLISYKSADADEEIQQAKKAIFLMGGHTERILKFQIPNSEQGRSLVCIRKKSGTPKTYPRKAGTPAKKPIL